MNARNPPESQRKRFEQTARELGVDLDEEKLKAALRKMGCYDTASHDKGSDENSPEDS